tara:strand:+ start:460 stop:1743 length:1284 start_codon:yes stop_codon:yes gene_type:complete
MRAAWAAVARPNFGDPRLNIITLTSILVSACALFSYINYKFIKLPTTIGIMAISLAFSTLLLLMPALGFDILDTAQNVVNSIDFSEALLHGMLSFLLFAGALHVNLGELKKQKYIVTFLAFFGTLFSTAMIGGLFYLIAGGLGLDIPFWFAALFGALISPTDPIAVMAILKKAGVPKSLEVKVVGESLLNDGIAVVLFIALLEIATSGGSTMTEVTALFIREAVGGAVLGLILGYGVFLMLKSVDNYQVEIFLTLGLVMGGYELATYLHTSGPIAMVVSGILVGNVGRASAMSDRTLVNLDNFWELIDEFLNAILFFLIGVELIIIPFDSVAFQAGLIMIPVILAVRYIAISVPVTVAKRFREFNPGTIPILTWGGLRGGISVALVLSMPSGEVRDILLLVTYCVVMFSILVQGLSIGRLARHYRKA